MTAAVITSLAQKSGWNPCGSTPSLVSETFEYESNSFVFYNNEHKVFVYFKLKGLTKNIDEDMALGKKISNLEDIPPVLTGGYLLLTKKRVLRLSAKHILKKQVLAVNALSYEEFENEFVNKYSGIPVKAGRTKSKRAIDETAGQAVRISEREDADVVMEDQIESLLFERDSQALGRLSDIARTRRAIKAGPTGDTQDGTE